MARKYLAFDIETARVVPGPSFQWRAYRPLGSTCIASLSEDDDEPRVWLSRTPSGTPAPQMTQSDTVAFVEYLSLRDPRGSHPIILERSGFRPRCAGRGVRAGRHMQTKLASATWT